MMTRENYINPIISGLIFIFMGASGFTVMMLAKDKMIFNESSLFLAKYSLIFLLSSGGLYFVIYGFLLLFGVLTPYINSENKANKIKTDFLFAIFFLPAFLPVSLLLFTESNNNKFKLIFALIIAVLGWQAVCGVSEFIKLTKTKNPTNL